MGHYDCQKGLDTSTPFLRLGNTIYRGAFDTTIGTDLIFAASATRPKKKGGCTG
jgi:hypothetical protein